MKTAQIHPSYISLQPQPSNSLQLLPQQKPNSQIKLKDVKLNKQRSSNCNTIFYQYSTNTIYIPVYLRILLKNIENMNLQQLQAKLNLTIILNTFTYGLPQYLRKFIDQNLQIHFKRDQKILLADTNVEDYNITDQEYKNMLESIIDKKQDMRENKIKKTHSLLQQSMQIFESPTKLQQKKSIQTQLTQFNMTNSRIKQVKVGKKYILRKRVHGFLQPYVFFTPFELIDIVFSAYLKIPKFYDENRKQYCFIKFNFMDRPQQSPQYISKRISITNDIKFMKYIIATKKLHVQYTRNSQSKTLMQLGIVPYNIKICDIKRQQFEQPNLSQIHTHSIQYAHFHIPIYKNPWTGLTTLFVPLWLFSAISLAVFFLSPSMADRIAVLATVMIAFVNLIPILRQNIPLTPVITLYQLLVYIQLIATVLCLIQSFNINTYDQTVYDQFMKNFHGWQDSLYIGAVFITLFVIFVPIIMYIIYIISQYKQINIINLNKMKGIDKTFQKWIKSDQGDIAFLNTQYINDIIFVHEEGFRQRLKLCMEKQYQKLYH